MPFRELRSILLPLALFAALVLVAATSFAQSSVPKLSLPNEVKQIGQILSVRKVPVGLHVASRYPQVRYYLLHITVRVPDKTYCGEYETSVIEEIDDLFAAKDKDIEVVPSRKKLTIKTPKDRKIKAWLSDPQQC